MPQAISKLKPCRAHYLVKNVGPTRELQFQDLVGVDMGGEQYKTYDVGFGNSPHD